MSMPKNNLARLKNELPTPSPSQASGRNESGAPKQTGFRFKPSKPESGRSISSSSVAPPSSFLPSRNPNVTPAVASKSATRENDSHLPAAVKSHKRASDEFQESWEEVLRSKRVKQDSDAMDGLDWDVADELEQENLARPPRRQPSTQPAPTSTLSVPHMPSKLEDENLELYPPSQLFEMIAHVRKRQLDNLGDIMGLMNGQLQDDRVLLEMLKEVIAKRAEMLEAEIAKRKAQDRPDFSTKRSSLDIRTSSVVLPTLSAVGSQPTLLAVAQPAPSHSMSNPSIASTSTVDVSFKTAVSTTSMAPPAPGAGDQSARSSDSTSRRVENKNEDNFDNLEDYEIFDDYDHLLSAQASTSRPVLQPIANVGTPRPDPSSRHKRSRTPESPSSRSIISIHSSPSVPSPQKPRQAEPDRKGKAKMSSETSKEQDRLLSSPYYPEIIKVLRNTFQLKDFRPNQLAAITATMAGRDVFVLMPTGGGKSLCYQVPAACETGKTSGLTIVVSPLLSLMEDQVRHLEKIGIDVAQFSGDTAPEVARQTRARLASQRSDTLPQILYITPEKLDMSDDTRSILTRLYERRLLARFVIDEAHCITTWGRDFRESYKSLNRLRKDYPGIPIMALTATANKEAIGDIVSRLGLSKDTLMLQQSFNRPNLYYEIREKRGKNLLGDMVEFIRSNHLNKSGIIYCLGRATCEEVAKTLRERHNMKAKHYHALMSADDKKAILDEWQRGRCHIIVATIAFGMGIDKPDVRFVIHHTLPKSMSGYYQETGRAGRDGLPSDCILYYTFADVKSIERMIEKDSNGVRPSPADIRRQKEELQVVLQYCQNITDCRRTQVLRYFGEQFAPESCEKQCNNCVNNDGAVQEDMTAPGLDALKLTQSLIRMRFKPTLLYLIDVFRGSQKRDIKDRGHNMIEYAGKWNNMDRDQTERLFNHLLSENALEQESVQNQSGWHNTYVQMGPTANDFLHGRKRLMMMVQKRKGGTIKKPPSTRIVRKAVVSEKRTTIVEEERSMLMDIEDEDEDEYQPDPDDPIEEDGFPPVRVSKTRRARMQDDPFEDEEDEEDGAPARSPEAQCWEAFKKLRAKLAAEEGLSKPESILNDEALQMLSVFRPQDAPSFKEKLVEVLGDADIAQQKWNAYGKKFLKLAIQPTIGESSQSVSIDAGKANGGPSRTRPKSAFNPQVLHEQFDFKVASMSASRTAPAPVPLSDNGPSGSAGPPRSKKLFRPSNSAPRPAGKSTGWIKAMPINKVNR